jgi:NAD(P)-dependent dehydrogenase (short-subunit alcohol dehydrogenase family)
MAAAIHAGLRSVVGRSVIVTGGASGLGMAAAASLAAAGARVTILDMNADAGAAVVARLGGDKAQFVKTDVTDEGSVAAAIAVATTKFGALHGAVNCAGICPAAKVLGKKGVHPLATFANVVGVNLIGTFNVARLAAEAMSKNEAAEEGSGERGCIVNTASIAAFEGQIGQAAYAASKGGVVGLTMPLARELAAHGIRVNTVCPGVMMTPLLAGLPKPAQDALSAAVPFPKRLGEPEEFAQLVRHIFENHYINGSVLRIDGALRLQ